MKQKALQHVSPPTLRELQTQLQTAILNGDEDILTTLLDGPRASRTTLFGVYRNAYTSRLIDILIGDYPFLRAYVGDELFRRLAASFVVAHPSRSQNARWFGIALPEFLEKQESAPQHPELAELAAIERAVATAFDSRDAKVLGLSDLATYPSEAWADLTFALHPSVTLLRGMTNAFDIWKSLKNEEAPPRVEHLSRQQSVAVWRHGTTPKARPMPEEEAMMCREAQRGVRFGVLCEMLATFDNPGGAPARAAGYLQSWLASDMLTSTKLVERKTPLRQTGRPNV
jgi:hypothetical protein